MEEWIHHWHKTKTDKYQELLDHKATGWEVFRTTLEVSHAQEDRIYSEVSSLRKKCSLMSQRCSYVIWLNRANSDFKPWRFHDAE